MKILSALTGTMLLVGLFCTGVALAGGGKGRVDKKDPFTGMEFVFVKGGCFQMGDTFGEADYEWEPVHEVCVDDFAIGKFEVTQGQWQQVMGNNPSYFSRCGNNCPVESVDWNDVQEFLRRINQQTGKNYRLPTEAEWEYAARSGGRCEKYSGGNRAEAVAWYEGNGTYRTHPVGQRQPNGLGLYDMSGNVGEWCQDSWDRGYYAKSPHNNPVASGGTSRVIRGGAWNGVEWQTQVTRRVAGGVDARSDAIGFRIVLPVGQ